MLSYIRRWAYIHTYIHTFVMGYVNNWSFRETVASSDGETHASIMYTTPLIQCDTIPYGRLTCAQKLTRWPA